MRLLDEILEMSLIDSGQAQVHKSAFELAPLLHEVRTMFEVEAEAKGISVRFRLAKDTPSWMITDPLKLRQILINLVGNAVKFTREGGVLVLVSADVPTGDKCALNIQVMDTGPGIDENEASLLFEKYSRGKGRADVQGTGLGLAISRHHAQLLGGVLAFESKLGRGSVFKVTIPVTWMHYPTNYPVQRADEAEEIEQAPAGEMRCESGTFEAAGGGSLRSAAALVLPLYRELIASARAGDRDEILVLCGGLEDLALRRQVMHLAHAYRYPDIVQLVSGVASLDGDRERKPS